MCNSWKNDLGVNCQLKVTPDFKTLRDQITKREIQGFFRTGWQMDYPSLENFLTPLYATGGSSNGPPFRGDRLCPQGRQPWVNTSSDVCSR